jgi:ABC-2 type transport system ATP-binding protein
VVQNPSPDNLIVRGMQIDEIGERAFTAGIALHELSPHAGSLEDLFLHWTDQAPDDEDIAS